VFHLQLEFGIHNFCDSQMISHYCLIVSGFGLSKA